MTPQWTAKMAKAAQPVDVIYPDYAIVALIDTYTKNIATGTPCYQVGYENNRNEVKVGQHPAAALQLKFYGMFVKEFDVLQQFFTANHIDVSYGEDMQKWREKGQDKYVQNFTMEVTDPIAIRKLAKAGMEFPGAKQLREREDDLNRTDRSAVQKLDSNQRSTLLYGR